MFSRKKLFGVIAGGALALALSFSLVAQAEAATLYVDAVRGQYRDPSPATKAANRLAITNPDTPAKTITNAAQLSETGDVIEVAPGTYTDSTIIAYVNNLVVRGKAGSPKPILKPGPGEDYAIVRITGSSYITFTGFEIDGSNAGPNVSAVLIHPRKTGTVITTAHHVTVSNNIVHDAGGAGIVTNPDRTDPADPVGCDYITIIGNEIYNCLATGSQGSSAISLLADENYDDGSAYHSRVEKNKVYNNLINTNNTGLQTDGNGIIIDGTGPSGPKTLIQNNLVYNNGGRGIHVFNSSNVDVLNNTCHQNVRAAGLYENGLPKKGVGEITATASVRPDLIVRTKNVNVVNNITFSRVNVPGYVALNTGSGPLTLDPTVKFFYNSYFGGGENKFERGTATTATNMFNISPGFVDAVGRNFKLANTSLAIDKGTMSKYAFWTYDDLYRVNVMGAGIDLGAYERAK
jgi:serralysin